MMRALICHDDGQLRRIESAIAAIESARPGQRQGKLALLEALQSERAALLQYSAHGKVNRAEAIMPRPRRQAWHNALAAQYDTTIGA